MFYKNIYIRDFGIFNNQNINNISNNLVIIGGKNRAGKSTFFKLLQFLPYGLSQNKSIPPADKQYYIEADIERNNKDYKLYLNGYAEPEIIDQKNNKFESAELFNNLDQLSYQQLFTISLDELQKLSKIADGKKKERRLYSILMGAGLSELVKVPELTDKYFNYAKNIGGVLGDPSVASFKPYYNEIKDAEELRDQALLEINKFNKKREELNKSKKELDKLEENISKLETKVFILDLLKNNYSTLTDLEKINFKLEQASIKLNELNFLSLNKISNYIESFKSKQSELNSYKNELIKSIKEHDLDNFLSFIKMKSMKINNYQQKKELLNEKIRNFNIKKNKINNEYQNLITACNNLNSSWKEPLKAIDNINLDLLNQEKLNYNLRKNDELKSSIKDIKNKIASLELEIKKNKSEITNSNYKSPASILKKTYFVLGLSMIILIFSFFFNYSQIKYFSLLIAFSAYLYYASNYKSSKLEKEKVDKLKKELNQLENELHALEVELEKENNNLRLIQEELMAVAESLKIKNIKEQQDFNYLKSYFLEVKDKKRRYNILKVEKNEKNKLKEEIIIDLNNIYNLLKKTNTFFIEKSSIKSIKDDKDEKLNEQAQILFKYLEELYKLKKKAFNYLNKKEEFKVLINDIKEILNDFEKEKKLEIRLKSYYKKAEEALAYNELKEKYQNKKNQLDYSLKASAKIKNHLNKVAPAADYYQSFLNLYRDFSSLTAVNKEKEAFTDKLTSAKNKKKKIEEKIITLKNDIKTLSSSEKIETAQKRINQAQNNLEKKAQRYAVNKSVSFILKKLRERMVEKAETELLKPASDILAKITDNYYKKLETADNFDSSEFKTITKDGSEFKSVEQLSRGSLEQLFLAVRISRIKEIKPHLPLVLDDSLVNFDSKHLYNTVEIITELAKEHQIFILSCHPNLIKYIKSISCSAQYWKLEKGQFELSNSKKLISYLSL